MASCLIEPASRACLASVIDKKWRQRESNSYDCDNDVHDGNDDDDDCSEGHDVGDGSRCGDVRCRLDQQRPHFSIIIIIIVFVDVSVVRWQRGS